MASESCCTTCLCHVACRFLRVRVRTRPSMSLTTGLSARVTVSRSVPRFAWSAAPTPRPRQTRVARFAARSARMREGTLREHKLDHARPRAGHVSLSDPVGLRDFRGRGCPRVPALPTPEPEW